jgi:AFG3 family protein
MSIVKDYYTQEDYQDGIWEHQLNQNKKIQKEKKTSRKQGGLGAEKHLLEQQEWDNDPRLPSLHINSILSFQKLNLEIMRDLSTFLLVSIIIMYPFTMFYRAKKSPHKENFSDWLTASTSSKKFKNINMEKNITTRFHDVAGLDQPKLEIQEFVDFLKNPEKYHSMGARIPRGALLSGPPGTGKTLLAKACAGESEVPFFYCSGSEFVEMFVGVGASRVRDLFEASKKAAPAIIFIDEIDSIGKKRNSSGPSRSEENSTLNQILVEMDGFDTNQDVVVFAATNRKELLDEALIRPGRFDRDIDVSLPELNERVEIYKVHLKPLKLNIEDTESLAMRLASLTPGFSGAQIMNVCNEAALLAVRSNHKYVTRKDFELAVEKVIAGIEKRMDETQLDTRKVVAVHEAGHGVVSWFLEGAMPLLKVTIIPRSKGALGFAQYMPNEGGLQKEQELKDQIVTILGGRIAEEEFFGEVTTGAYDDLQKAKAIAREMVLVCGMTKELGAVNLPSDRFNKSIASKSSQDKVDKLINEIIKEAANKCRSLIREHRSKIQELSDELLEKNTLDLQDIQRILGERPFESKKEFKKYLEASYDIKNEIMEEMEEESLVEEMDDGEDDLEDDDDEFFVDWDSDTSVVVKIDDSKKK